MKRYDTDLLLFFFFFHLFFSVPGKYPLLTLTCPGSQQAAQECERFNYIPELVYLYSKTGQTKRALYLIIDRLGDVSRAIAFAKEQDDPDLWEDLLTYSMDKPRFIRALLEEVGTAIDPIKLIRRIPEGLEIEGLREGLKHIMKEHEIQHSICEGVARVLRSEVAAAQAQLRSGQRRGVKFEVVGQAERSRGGSRDGHHADASAEKGVNGDANAGAARKWSPGRCAECLAPFDVWETETLVGFACGHVFHLTHLLQRLHPGEEVDEVLLHGVAEQRMTASHLIGAKVTHARLLKDRIAGGCPVCASKQDSEGGGGPW